MPAVAVPLRGPDVSPPVQTAGEAHRWTVEEYHRLGDAGGFLYGDHGPHETRVELLHGVIYDKHPPGGGPSAPLRWTRAMYERLVENGGFDGLRVELIHGQVLDKMSPQGSPHSTAIVLAHSVLSTAFSGGAHVRAQLPIRALNQSEPEPDLAVVAGTARDFAGEHPSAALLVVEVSHSTLQNDRTKKLAAYAESGSPEYWIVNIEDACLEVYRDPDGDTYRTRFVAREGEHVSPLTRSTARIAVSDLLP